MSHPQITRIIARKYIKHMVPSPSETLWHLNRVASPKLPFRAQSIEAPRSFLVRRSCQRTQISFIRKGRHCESPRPEVETGNKKRCIDLATNWNAGDFTQLSRRCSPQKRSWEFKLGFAPRCSNVCLASGHSFRPPYLSSRS